VWQKILAIPQPLLFNRDLLSQAGVEGQRHKGTKLQKASLCAFVPLPLKPYNSNIATLSVIGDSNRHKKLPDP